MEEKLAAPEKGKNIPLWMVFLYPYPYQVAAILVAAVMFFFLGIPIYAIYRWFIGRLTSEQVKHLKKRLFIAGTALTIILLSSGALSLVKIVQVNRQLGFGYATPDTPAGELFLITKVEYGKTMFQAGLRENDEVQFGSTSDLYALLIHNQGKEVEFSVKRGGKIIPITFVVPEMEIWQFRMLPFSRF